MSTARSLTVAAIALLAGACGSAAPQATGGRSNDSPGAAAYRYADCMRAHGLSGFPDPRVHVNGNEVSVIQGLPPSMAASPHFKSAQRACRGLVPGPGTAGPSVQPQRRRALLAFARCMRGRGISSFPDPDPQGQITHAMLSSAGVDIRSHAVYVAAIACARVTHGAVTAAQVQQAVSGSH